MSMSDVERNLKMYSAGYEAAQKRIKELESDLSTARQSLYEAVESRNTAMKRIAELERKLALAEGADSCEACGRLIQPGEDRHDWADGVTTCMQCGGPGESSSPEAGG